MNKVPEDERTPEQIEAKAKVFQEWLDSGTRLNAVQTRSIRLFLKRHMPTQANPEFIGDQP